MSTTDSTPTIIAERLAQLCACGCGRPAPVAVRTSSRRGHVRGQPVTYVSGHNNRGKIQLRYSVSDKGYLTPCWLWNGPLNAKGYGHVQIHCIHTGAHRYVFELYRGSIPDGLSLDHLCRQPGCVNPEHLEPVTIAENNRRARIAGQDENAREAI